MERGVGVDERESGDGEWVAIHDVGGEGGETEEEESFAWWVDDGGALIQRVGGRGERKVSEMVVNEQVSL